MDYVGASKGLKDAETPPTNLETQSLSEVGKALDVTMRGTGVALGVAQMAKMTSTPPGVSPGLGGFLMLLSALGDHRPESPRNHVIVMMPESTVPSGADPLPTLIDAFGAAGVYALSADSYELQEKENRPPLGPTTVERTLTFKGGACQDKVCVMATALFRSGGGQRYELVDAPAYLGGGRTYRWFNANWSYFPRITVDKKPVQADTLLKLAEKLPDWIYLYFAADRSRSFPFMTGQGKLLLFVKPSSSQRAEDSSVSQTIDATK